MSPRFIALTLGVLAFTSDSLQFTGGGLAGYDLRIWQGILLMMGLLLLSLEKIVSPSVLGLLASTIVAHLAVSAAIQGRLFGQSVVQLTAFVVGSVLVYSYIRYIGIAGVLRIYYISAIIISLSLLAEELVFLTYPTALSPYYDFFRFAGQIGPFVRATGLLGEPSQAGILVTPALYLCLVRRKYWALALILGATVFTFSTLAFLAALIIAAIFVLTTGLARQKIWLLVISLTLISSVFLLPTFQARITPITSAPSVLLQGDTELEDFLPLGASFATLAMNSLVAFHAMRDTYLVGSGFGSFQDAYRRYSPLIADVDSIIGFFYNKIGGGSLLLRIATETGVLGLALVGFGFMNGFKALLLGKRVSGSVPGSSGGLYLQGLSLGLIILLTYLIRKDQYFNFNFLVALWTSYICAVSIFNLHRSTSGVVVR